MTDESPVVSVVIPAYNAAGTIRRAVDSVLAQDHRPLELIVVEDKSTDDTLSILRTYRDDRLRVIASERNNGETRTRNRGIDEAQGTYVAFLDADDEWLPGKLRAQVRAMQANPDWVMCGCDMERVTLNGLPLPPPADPREPVSGPEAWRTMLAYSFLHVSSLVARRDAVVAAGGFDPDLPVAGDQDMWIRLAIVGAAGFVPERLVRIFMVPDSLMRRYPRGELDYLLPMIRKHIQEQRHRLTPREIRAILGRRYAVSGRNLYRKGYVWAGARLMVHATLLGSGAGDTLVYLVAASPMARWLKARLGWSSRPPAPASGKR